MTNTPRVVTLALEEFQVRREKGKSVESVFRGATRQIKTNSLQWVVNEVHSASSIPWAVIFKATTRLKNGMGARLSQNTTNLTVLSSRFSGFSLLNVPLVATSFELVSRVLEKLIPTVLVYFFIIVVVVAFG